MSDLSERSRRILRALVTEFIEHGEPVGSRTLAERYVPDLSPATIRNVLAELEEAGYLYQRHTSAGRVPTELGFRAFVDGVMAVMELSKPEEEQLQSLDVLPPGRNLLQESGRVLSELAGMASVIAASQGDTRVLAQVHFIRAQDQRSLLAVLMFRDGSVETRFVSCDSLPDDNEIGRMHQLLGEVVPGHTLAEVRHLLAERLDAHRLEIDQLSRRAFALAIEAADEIEEEPILVIQGQERLIDQPEFADVERLRELVRALQEKKSLVSMLDRTMQGRTVQVLVGHEAGNLAGGALSFVVAPFSEAGRPLGLVGIVGPTRMNYPKMVPLVSATAHVVTAAHERALRTGTRRMVRRKRYERRS